LSSYRKQGRQMPRLEKALAGHGTSLDMNCAASHND
jgi:hypothetical protein